MSTYNLTADELLLVYLTLISRDEESGNNELFMSWFLTVGATTLRKLFNSLKEKGIIHKDYETKEYNPNEIPFNKTFVKSWYKNTLQMGTELFEAYPPFINIQNKYIPVRDISKKFDSLDEFYFFYSSQIGHSYEKHKKVLEILEWAKENGHLNIGIINFVVSHQWDSLQKLKDNPEVAPISQNSIYDD